MKREAPQKLSEEQRAEMVRLYLETDMSAREVAEKFGVVPSSVIYHAKKARKKEGG